MVRLDHVSLVGVQLIFISLVIKYQVVFVDQSDFVADRGRFRRILIFLICIIILKAISSILRWSKNLVELWV